ncbi:hypothetical protein RhiirA5_423702 [Rhizophagus irregularis]|uniref:Uncharacterized protein n=2 Tax=Rhizophagus irregularis TaxID=588596 RepID=A0A2N0P9L4_9GLOM|nr:hypothetical protein RirG_073740 [Rhizophagus irregularis DAOM 197198w]PKC03483.1 hypothetical protein RhiirA5_423702 [Rhizophagus irregularis]GBC44354.2 hypothetical protein GLOIN_2v1791351 [Rhizophagus irregularis DAOM 181602=DAOM 197198]
MSEIFFDCAKMALANFIENGFLQTMFSKSGNGTLDKATLLMTTFGDGANLKYFAEQSKATNIQPITLSLIISIASYAVAAGWNAYKMALYNNKEEALGLSNLDDLDDQARDCDTDDIIENTPIMPTPNPVPISQHELPDVVMTPVDQLVTTKILRKEEINKSTCVTDDKQVNNQSTLKGYEVSSPEEKERIRDIKVYDIPYTWSTEKIAAELKLWDNSIMLLIKRQRPLGSK